MALLLAAAHGRAWSSTYAPVDPTQFAWQQKPGARVPLQTGFTDDLGKPISLHDLAGKSPLILDLGYFHCPSLCGVVRADLFLALQQSGLVPGRDYSLIAASIDPAETPKDAAAARRSDAAEFPGLDVAAFHYLTGSQRAISTLEQAVGFRARYDARYRQFLHPSGLVFLSRDGVVSSYVLGVGYKAGDIRAAAIRARAGGIARAALPILLLCFHFDSRTGRYTLAITKVLRLMALLTVAGILGLLLVLSHSPAKSRIFPRPKSKSLFAFFSEDKRRCFLNFLAGYKRRQMFMRR
jgi:protein SCO1/2